VENPLTHKWGLYAYINELAAGSLLTGGGVTSLHEPFGVVNARHTYPLHKSFVVTLVKHQALHIEFRVTAFDRPVAGFTNYGTGYSGGTAAIFFDNPTFTAKDETLFGGQYLGDQSLGRDEFTYVKGDRALQCLCYTIKVHIQKR